MGENPWAQFRLGPTAVQLAIQALPLRFVPQDEEELFPYLRQAILNDKATRFSQPGTSTRAEILAAPSRSLRLLSLSTPSMLRPLLQVSSFSSRNARLNLPSQQAAPPSLRTAGDTDTIPRAPPSNARCALSLRFIILTHLTDVRIPHAPGPETICQSRPVAQPCPPIA